MNIREKKVSIIVAAYNVEDYIERCINTLINQTLKDIEIIVVNDGSIDSTRSVIERFKYDKRLLIVNKKNEGLIEARKTGLALAKGKYVLFVDGDDWIHLDACNKLYKTAENENADIVYFRLVIAKGKRRINIPFNNFGKVNNNEYLQLVLQDKIRANIVLQFIRREFINENNIVFPDSISYAEDLALTIFLAIKHPIVISLNEALYYYFQRNDSITNIITPRVFEIDKAINYIEKNLKDEGLLDKYNEQLDYLKFIHLFYYRIITAKRLTKIHKKLYWNWIEKKININNNTYYLNMINRVSLENRIKLNLFNIKYFWGYIYINFKYYILYIPKRLVKRIME